MEAIREDEAEFLSSLEERIVKAVELVAGLRRDNALLAAKLAAAAAEKEAGDAALAASQQEAAALRQEIDSLHSERKQVRSRIEKLLGQMDLLSAS